MKLNYYVVPVLWLSALFGAIGAVEAILGHSYSVLFWQGIFLAGVGAAGVILALILSVRWNQR